MENPFHCHGENCKRKAPILFKGDPNDTDTWFALECDTCHDTFCANCITIDEINGTAECHDCYQSRLIREWKQAAPQGQQ